MEAFRGAFSLFSLAEARGLDKNFSLGLLGGFSLGLRRAFFCGGFSFVCASKLALPGTKGKGKWLLCFVFEGAGRECVGGQRVMMRYSVGPPEVTW